jgi:4-hydroxy-3-methylbut-2-enyl diphosphate reductase
MEVVLANSAGFCFGVKRAVETVYEQIREQEKAAAEGKKTLPIYTYGPIIHNEQVVEDLAKKGVKVLETPEDMENLREEGIVIIRSHGVERSVYEKLQKKGLTVVDATCPFVKKIHNIVEKESSQGKKILIVGNPTHPEVQGIMGWCDGETVCIEDPEQAAKLTFKENEEVCLVSQTTFNHKKFKECVEIIKKNGYNTNVADTICNATEERQTEARELASRADVMIVIGGAHSSNSRKLYEICREQCENTYFIQTLDDLHLELPKAARLVGITAGASTPNNIIEEVQSYVRRNF